MDVKVAKKTISGVRPDLQSFEARSLHAFPEGGHLARNEGGNKRSYGYGKITELTGDAQSE